MRLIDAEKLMQKISKMIDYCQDNNLEAEMSALFQVGDAVIDCPTIDAVPVVRCKDCDYICPTQDGRYICRATTNPNWVNADHFCSYGERKEE